MPILEDRAGKVSPKILGESRFHHIGYLVKDMESSMTRFRQFFPVVLVNAAHHPEQKITVSLLETAAGTLCSELVKPDTDNILMRRQLAAAGSTVKPYHICFWVADFNNSYRHLRSIGWSALTRPFRTHYAGWEASHLCHPDTGIIEIMG